VDLTRRIPWTLFTVREGAQFNLLMKASFLVLGSSGKCPRCVAPLPIEQILAIHLHGSNLPKTEIT
jgi:hypothetical protein